jgi:hypothetical protein
MENERSAWCAGVKHKTSPFANLTDERDIEQRLELFMSEVLIPLAVQARRPACVTRRPSRVTLNEHTRQGALDFTRRSHFFLSPCAEQGAGGV